MNRVKDSLRESKERYRSLFEASKDAILVFDDSGGILDVNRSATVLFGYSKEELLSLDSERLFFNPEDWKHLWQGLNDGGFANGREMEMKRKDGSKIIVHLSLSEIRDDQGKTSGYHGIARDVTEHIRLEQQLLHARKMESIALLAGGVAHEFNNLLTAISGYGQIIRDGIPQDNDLLRQSIGQLLYASECAADLTRALLTFSRNQVIVPKPVPIDTVISNAVKLIKRVIGDDIDLCTVFCEKKLIVMVDAGQFNQVLLNLATNARDAMPRGGHIRISTREVVVRKGYESRYDVAAPGRYACIAVSDTGSGIEEKSLGKIFDPFFTTKEIGKGKGLGLAMIYGAVRQNNGSILVNSEPGKGTTFNIYLPLIRDDRQVDCKHQMEVTAALRPDETLLIAEDEVLVSSSMKKILENAGYKVILAMDGEEALEKFRENQEEISLILSDVVMPRMSGMEFLEEVRRLKPGVRVLFISGYSADFLEEKGTFKKGLDLITKPFAKEELLRRVRQVLDRQ